MKEKNWKKLANELMELIGESTPSTRVKAQVGNDCIELLPDGENEGNAFHHMASVVDFCRVKKCSCYTVIDLYTNKVKCMIF